ncbi:MAG: thioredoxin family protein [Muribaculaceae bacterium]|nr:thioredoxin family protein [Muribaculaceae bacterium]
MKKGIFLVALLSVLFMATSALNEKRFDVTLSSFAPIETVENEYSKYTIGGVTGRYTLVTFWDSSDAESRQQVNEYAAMMHKNQMLKNNIDFVGINFDEEKIVFDEIADNDNLNVESQYHVEGAQARDIINSYRLENGYGSVLLGPHGDVVAYNPDLETLATL